MDVATDSLDELIERRASREPDPDELEPSYQESVRRYRAREQARVRWEWIRHFEHMCRVHTVLAEEHRRSAESLDRGRSLGEGRR